MFKKRKLSINKKRSLHYGRSPSQSPSVIRSRNKKILRTVGPTNFHTRKNKKPVVKSLRERIPKRIKLITKVAIATILVVAFVRTFFFSSYFLVENIVIESEDQTATQISNNIISDLREYKGENIFGIDEPEIIEKIQTKYPEIEALKIDTDWPDTITVSFQQFPPAANITNLTEESNKKFIVNTVGYIIAQDIDNPLLPYIKIKSETQFNTEAPIISPKTLEYILGSINYFKEKFGMAIIETEYKLTPREVHLRTERYFYIWLDAQKPYENQLKKLKKALVKLDIYNENLEYIDLRITGESGEKIIYKRK
ncbi:FtsQ-type POTRA domain-containing protein [Candidatus Peregrinibacteria bacterium]|nr:FtsQ-type POTRA domain-containing protein [Candidatus Peregrinibacteria bacterium]MBT4056090.1 FtsQ-type POTRA domain-containing protein [Candidatus Peregrinibacteria bacterium]